MVEQSSDLKNTLKKSVKKSLAIVVPELLPVPPVKGGAVEHWVHEVAGRLNAEQFDITIISRPSGGQSEGAIAYIGIPWTRLEKAFYWLKERVTWRNPLRYLAKIQNVASYGLRVAKQVAGFDIVVIHNEPNLLLFLRKLPSQKLILHMHNEHLTHAAFRWLYRRALRKADLVICVSAYIKNSATQIFPEHAHKFEVLFNATNPEVFKPYGEQAKQAINNIINFEDDKIYLLYVGRLTAEKGVHILIEAFAQLLQSMPNARLIITGSSFFEGATKTAYQQSLISHAKPVSHAIVFTGFIPHEKLRYLYSAADLVVLPSIWQDPCPLVVLESMASGTCLVATKVGGIPEIIVNGKDGMLVEANNSHAITQCLLAILNEPEKKSQIEQAARQKIESAYAWQHLVKKLETLLSPITQPI
ncbi:MULTISPECIES: glycosyltransferase family 4 protein [Methylotenera]|uniref:glycosyltransferase family 4 protein n=1 Tax=Methylotenera TaxID=359407 RepID=UPI00037D3962|nr:MULTISPECIES: glycosyltransferase family 4 protein [Methylotenera]